MKRVDYFAVVTVFLSLPIILVSGLIENAPINTADSLLHINRMISTTNSLMEGVFWPRWYPDMFVGYGYPLGNYYPPGASLIGATGMLLGLSPATMLLWMQAAAFITGATGAYYFARQLSAPPAAMLTSAAYVYTPFLFFQIYHIGNLPQLLAFSLIPWCCGAVAHAARRPACGLMARIGLFTGATLLLHALAGALVFLITGGYAVLASFAAAQNWPGIRRRLFITVGGVVLGFLLASIYWLPAVLETYAIQNTEISTARVGANLVDNFVLTRDIFQPAVTVDQAAQIPGFRLSLGLPQLALIAGSVLLAPLFLRERLRWKLTHIIFSALGIAICLYLVTYHSVWIWQSVPGAEIFMHPWRLYGVVYVMMIPLAALVFQWLVDRFSARVVPLVLAVLFIAILPVYFPATDELAHSDITSLTDTMRYEEATGNFGTVAFEEYRPAAVQSTDGLYTCYSCYEDWTWRIYPQESALPDEVSVSISDGDQSRATEFLISTPDDFDFVLHQFYFPGWRAELNGEPIEIQVSAPNGLMMISIPAGEQHLMMRYAGTQTQFMGSAITAFALLIAFTLLLRPAKNQSQDTASRRHIGQQAGITAGLCLVMILLTSAALKLYVEPHTNWFRLFSLPDTPPTIRNPLETIFHDETGQPMIALLGYNLNVSETVQRGDWIYLDLYWRALTPLTDDIRVQVELVDEVFGVPLLAVDKPNPGIIPSTGWRTDRYLTDRHILTITEDIPPYTTRLQLSVVTDSGARWTSETMAERIVLAPLRINGSSICPVEESMLTGNADFGDILRLTRLSLNDNDNLLLMLCWDVNQSPDVDYRLFIHYYEDDLFLGSEDRRPIDQYRADRWRRGQTLAAQYDLAPPPATNVIHLGFYDPDNGERLPLNAPSSSVLNDSLLLTLP